MAASGGVTEDELTETTLDVVSDECNTDTNSLEGIEPVSETDGEESNGLKTEVLIKAKMCGQKVENKENLPDGDLFKCGAVDKKRGSAKVSECKTGVCAELEDENDDTIGDDDLWNSSRQRHAVLTNDVKEEIKTMKSCDQAKNNSFLTKHVRANGLQTDYHDINDSAVAVSAEACHVKDANLDPLQSSKTPLCNVSVSSSNGLGLCLSTSKTPCAKLYSYSSDSADENQSLTVSTPSSIISENTGDLMRFAEVLYKCTLCTSIPSILTSKSSFLQHVNEQHRVKKKCVHFCTFCDLNFQTKEDLKEHTLSLHSTGSDVKMPCDKTGSDVIDTHPDHLADNDSDSDSSGHRQLKAKVAKRSKPLQDFEEPKQLVDHAGIETSDGSLDLSKKEGKESQGVEKESGHPRMNFNLITQTPKVKEEVNLINVQQITDQILKSNSQNQNPSAASGGGVRLSFTPSFTPEFGKYTKLVREGGNIVYFCQVCNWKSPVKTAFHVHCGSSSHKAKVSSAEDPDSLTDQSETGSQKDSHLPISSVQACPNVSVPSKFAPSRDSQLCWPLSYDRSAGLTESSLFYNYVRQRSFLPSKKRTPVVSPYSPLTDTLPGNDSLSRLSDDHLNDRKRKKGALPTAKNIVHHRFNNSDSDSDESKGSFQEQGDYNQFWKSHSSNISLMRNQLFKTGSYGVNSAEQLDGKVGEHITATASEYSDLSRIKQEYSDGNSIASRKRKTDSPVNDGEPVSKATAAAFGGKTLNETGDLNVPMPDKGPLFKLYRCHACAYEYSNIEEYESHFERVHKTMGTGGMSSRAAAVTVQGPDSGTGSGVPGRIEGSKGKVAMEAQGSLGSFEVGENWRVQKLKDILPQFLHLNEKGNTSRDYLLQCISLTTGHSDAPLWSSACNKAMREVFPSSLAQRKGKYKRTYYFGVSMVDQFQCQEEVTPSEPDGPVFQSPLRDVNYDMEKIIEQLPEILAWNGCMETGVYRGDILMLLADKLKDQDVVNWGAQCNRAIRLVFPKVDMKRKGKFKTTMYFGVTFQQQVLKERGDYPNFWGHFGDRLSNMTENGLNDEEAQRELTLSAARRGASPGKDGERPAEYETGQTVFPQWFKNEARRQMDQYLVKFGGVTMFEEASGDGTNGEENDGDDEEDSIESSVRG